MTRVYLSGDPVHDRVLEAFYQGIEGPKELVKNWDYKPTKVAVIFGVYKSRVPKSFPRGEIFRRQREKNLDVIVLETGYINRGDGEANHFAAGFNGLNGRADFRNENMPDNRARKLVDLKQWKGGKNVILCSQIPWDASIDGSCQPDHKAWLLATAERIGQCSDRPIIFRPHPLARKVLPLPPECSYSSNDSLRDDLKDAHAVVTFNSNAAVEALIEGVPVFVADRGSMCWSVANRSLISVDAPNRPDRTQWLNDLAYTQWTLEEFRRGEAWRHLLS